MACQGPGRPDYNCQGWIELRDRIVSRDGHRCRNCGSHEKLSVHHWLPLPEHRGNINEWGYKDEKCPLIVPESGLVTVCQRCHDVLTDARKIAAVGQELTRRTTEPEAKTFNIFEIWALNDKILPFKVVRATWSNAVNQFMLVEKIEVSKWPYGFAWGRYVRESAVGELSKISGAGSYQWNKKD